METTAESPAARGAVVRRAQPGDAPAIEEVRVAGWQGAYRGIVDDSYLDAMRPDPHRFADQLDGRSSVAHYVATAPPGAPPSGAGGAVVGWSSLGPPRDSDAPAGARELYSCYVRPGWWRGGIGRRLLRAALAPVPDTAPVLLWALRDYAAARAFYERQGFAPDGAERDVVPSGTGPGRRPLRAVRYLRAAREAG